MINYIPERIYYAMKQDPIINDFRTFEKDFDNKIKQCKSLVDYLILETTYQTDIIDKISKFTEQNLNWFCQYQISIGNIGETQLEWILKNQNVDNENKLFIMSHLIQDYSTHDYTKYIGMIREYISLYLSKATAKMSMYIHYKALCNLIVLSFISKRECNLDKLIGTIKSKMKRDFTKEEDSIIKMDICETLLQGAMYLYGIEPYPKLTYKYLEKAHEIYDNDKFKYSIVYPTMMLDYFKINSSLAAESGNFNILKHAITDASNLSLVANDMLGNIYETLRVLNFYDKDNIEPFLCILRFITKLQNIKDIRMNISLNNISGTDKQYINSNMGITHKSKILRPNINMRNDVDNWFTKSTGFIRMAGGTIC